MYFSEGQLLRATAANSLQPISRPCSIKKYPSSRMANRYNRIFDAGGLYVSYNSICLLLCSRVVGEAVRAADLMKA